MQDYSIMEDLRHDRVKFADDDVHRVDEEQKLREQLEWEAEEEQREREWREEHKRKQMDEELQRQRDSKERDDQERMWQQERIRKIRASEMSKAEEEILTQQQQFLGRILFLNDIILQRNIKSITIFIILSCALCIISL